MHVSRRSAKDLIRNCFLVNTASAIVAILVNSAVTGLSSLFQVEYVVSVFVYSHFIGTFISLVIFFYTPNWKIRSTIVRLTKVFLSILGATVSGIFLARLVLGAVFVEVWREGVIPGWQNFIVALGIAVIVGFGVYFYEVSQTELRREQFEAETARSLATKAQLASLESRVHPHFLFNTLNSIAALINEDPAVAEKMVERLSALLRYSLDSDSKRLVSLTQEMDITKKYLEIEKVRFGKRFDFKIEVMGDVSRVNLPQLSLQTLVENSIKHVVAAKPGFTEIVISTSVDGDKARVEVRDSGPGFCQELIHEGHGLDLLRKRFDVFFGPAGQIIIGDAIVALEIPLQPHVDSIPAAAETVEPKVEISV